MVQREGKSLIAHPETRLQDGDDMTIIGKLDAIIDDL